MVQLQGITFGYRRRERLFDGLGLTLTPGNIYGLLGRNGAGKTTLLRLMSGLLFAKTGSARVAGEEVRRRTPAFLRELYFVPEEFHTPALSPRALVRLYSVFYPRFDHAAMERHLADLEVDPDQSMTAMSYGQKKKVLLAFAVASQCRLLILDEPTNGLDIPAKSQFRRLLAGAADDDRVIIVSTHQVRDLEHLIDPIVILEQGTIVFQHSVHEISSFLAVLDAGAAMAGDSGDAIYVEPAGGAGSGRALVPAAGRGIDVRDGGRPGVAVQLGGRRSPARGSGVRRPVREREELMMHESKVFSVARAWYALRADLHQQSRAVLVAAGGGAALILAVNVISAANPFGWNFHAVFFPLALLIGGHLFTSTLFADIHTKQTAHAYLTLPISTLERWAVRLLLSTIGYTVMALVAYSLVTLLGAALSQLVWAASHGIFAPSIDSWRAVLVYLVTSSLFLFGAVYFRRWHAFKVVLAITAVGLGLSLLAAGLAWLLLPGFSGQLESLVINPRVEEAMATGAKILFWAIMSPLFWFLTYRRLGEVEV